MKIKIEFKYNDDEFYIDLPQCPRKNEYISWQDISYQIDSIIYLNYNNLSENKEDFEIIAVLV
jgi:hypothetical protein